MPKLKKLKSGKIKRHKFRKAIGVKEGFGKSWSAPSVTFRVEFSWENLDGSEVNEQVHWIECRKFQGEERDFLKAHYTQAVEEWTEGETIESKFVCVYCADFLVKQRKKAEEYWHEQVLSQMKKQKIPSLDRFAWDFFWGSDERPSSFLDGQNYYESEIDRNFPIEYFSMPSALMFNQAFVFATPKKGNETIRFPIYQIKWTEELAAACFGYEDSHPKTAAKNSVFNQNIEIVMKNSIWHKP